MKNILLLLFTIIVSQELNPREKFSLKEICIYMTTLDNPNYSTLVSVRRGALSLGIGYTLPRNNFDIFFRFLVGTDSAMISAGLIYLKRLSMHCDVLLNSAGFDISLNQGVFTTLDEKKDSKISCAFMFHAHSIQDSAI